MLCITSTFTRIRFGSITICKISYFSVFYGYFMVLNRIYIAWIVKFRPDNNLIRKTTTCSFYNFACTCKKE